jgi:hypothetical protein
VKSCVLFLVSVQSAWLRASQIALDKNNRSSGVLEDPQLCASW